MPREALYQRARALQYIGIGNSIHTRLNEHHHKLQKVTRERQIWLGEIATAKPSGKKLKVTKATLDYSEWLHAGSCSFLSTKRRPRRCRRVASQ